MEHHTGQCGCAAHHAAALSRHVGSCGAVSPPGLVSRSSHDERLDPCRARHEHNEREHGCDDENGSLASRKVQRPEGADGCERTQAQTRRQREPEHELLDNRRQQHDEQQLLGEGTLEQFGFEGVDVAGPARSQGHSQQDERTAEADDEQEGETPGPALSIRGSAPVRANAEARADGAPDTFRRAGVSC